jgi:hypothetical protein
MIIQKAEVEKQGDDTDDKDAPSKDEPTL